MVVQLKHIKLDMYNSSIHFVFGQENVIESLKKANPNDCIWLKVNDTCVLQDPVHGGWNGDMDLRNGDLVALL